MELCHQAASRPNVIITLPLFVYGSLAPETHTCMCYIAQFVSGSAFFSGLEVPTHIRSDHRTSPVESRQPQTLERGASRSATDVGHDDQFKNRDTGEFNPIFLDLAY
jgi:hypothetical protein